MYFPYTGKHRHALCASPKPGQTSSYSENDPKVMTVIWVEYSPPSAQKYQGAINLGTKYVCCNYQFQTPDLFIE